MVTHAVIAFTLLGLACGTLFRPAVALGGIALMFLIEQYGQSGSAIYIQRSWLLNVLLALIVVEGVVIKIFKNELKLSTYPAAGYVLIGLFMFALSTAIWSLSREATLKVLWIQAPYLVLSILAAPLLVNSREDVEQALKTIGIVGFIFVALILFTRSWGARGLELSASYYSRTASAGAGGKTTESNSLELASAAGRIAIITLMLPLFRTVPLGLLIRWAMVLICGVMIYYSQSRGQLVAMVAILLVFVVWIDGFKNINTYLLILALIGGGLALAYMGLSAIGDRWAAEKITDAFYGARVYKIEVITKAWMDAGPFYWLMGIGNSASYRTDILGIYPHNVPIEVLCEEGVVGFALLVTFMYLVIRQGVGLTRTVNRTPYLAGQSRVIPAVLALFAFESLLALKQGSLATSYPLYFYALILMRLATTAYLAPSAQQQMYEQSYGYSQPRPA